MSVKLRGLYLKNWLMTEDFVKHSTTIKHSNIHHDSSFCRNDPDFGAPRIATTPDCLKQFRPAKFRGATYAFTAFLELGVGGSTTWLHALGFGFQVSLVMEGDGVCELPKKLHIHREFRKSRLMNC